jgi:hypothetical protein
MVQRLSAQIHVPFEHRVAVNNNHTDMVKFAAQIDPTYQTAVTHLRECIGV